MKKSFKYILILVISLFMICGINKVEAKNIDFNRNVYLLDDNKFSTSSSSTNSQPSMTYDEFIEHVQEHDNSSIDNVSTNANSGGKSGCTIFSGDYRDGYNKTHYYLKWGITLIRILAPVLVVIFGLIDFLGALFSGEEKNMKDAQRRALTRLIAAIVLLIVPSLLKLIINFSSIVTNIGSDDIFCGLI